MTLETSRRVVCVYCERDRSVRADGKVPVHRNVATNKRCQGSERPAEVMPLAPTRMRVEFE